MFPDQFIHTLAETGTSKSTCNQYALHGDGSLARHNAARRYNLRSYLLDMQRISPKIVLIGEAPGYRGCRLTGIPFTSRVQVTRGIQLGSYGTIFGEDSNYLDPAERPELQSENSATIVWSAIKHYRPIPLLWNAYPFHPHKVNNTWSNRKPTKNEIEQGVRFIGMLIHEFQFECVVAVGNSAALSLNHLETNVAKVRHPSFGGKSQFVEQLKNVASTTRLIRTI